MEIKWTLWPCMYWLFWALGFAGWEIYAATSGGRVPMLTQAIVRYVPWWVTLPGLAFLFYHFAVRYFDPVYIAKLHS